MTRVIQTVLALSSVLLALAPGCATRAGQGELTEYAADAPELAGSRVDADSGIWESAAWDDPSTMEANTTWIPFRPHEQVRMEHDLGRTPSLVLTYLSFSQDGATPSLAAGDLSRVVEANETFVTVWNDTNGTYFVRVVLE